MHAHTPQRHWIAAAALAMASVGAWAGPGALPFKATVATQEILGFDLERCPGTGLVGTTTGKGTASHLGAVTLLATDCPVLIPGVAPTFGSGQLTLTAANGDELRASYSGSLIPVPGAAGLFMLNGPLTITGGTGRFSRATGQGQLQGSIVLGPQVSPGQYQVSGSLSY